jgi:hypothetical protein
MLSTMDILVSVNTFAGISEMQWLGPEQHTLRPLFLSRSRLFSEPPAIMTFLALICTVCEYPGSLPGALPSSLCAVHWPITPTALLTPRPSSNRTLETSNPCINLALPVRAAAGSQHTVGPCIHHSSHYHSDARHSYFVEYS